jgi:hypothetical protein
MSLRHLRDVGLLIRAPEHQADVQSQIRVVGQSNAPLYPA